MHRNIGFRSLLELPVGAPNGRIWPNADGPLSMRIQQPAFPPLAGHGHLPARLLA